MRENIYRIFGLFLLIAVVLVGCIKEIYPDLNPDDTRKIVVSGQLTDLAGYQYVSVSYSSDVFKPSEAPIKDCIVKLEDSNGLEYDYTQYHDGEYRIWIDSAALDYSAKYRIVVTTPDNQIVKSEWENFNSCPKIDKVYYETEESQGQYFMDKKQGLRFYMDFVGAETDSRYYKIDLVETFEYHTEYPLEWWFDGTVHHEVPPDYSKSICYNIIPIREIYVLTTDNLQKNEYKRFKLNYVTNEAQRLSHTYSLLFRQLAIDFKAYNYWNQMKINMSQEGGLYTNQPIPIKGNMINTTDTTKDVLGYFVVAKADEYRIFVPPTGFEVSDYYCTKFQLRYGIRFISSDKYPVYLESNGNSYKNVQLSAECVDCTTVGNGKTTKPVYWP